MWRCGRPDRHSGGWGYTFHLLARDGARVVIDGVEVAKTGPPFAQVCGSQGNAMRYDRGVLGMRAGGTCFTWKGCTQSAKVRHGCCGKGRGCGSTRCRRRRLVMCGWMR